MAVLIDGFNLLHAARSSLHSPQEIGRAQLSRMLGMWSACAKEKVTIVWDGAAPAGDLARQLSDERIVAVYAEEETADDRIAWMLEADSGARHTVVVSDDNEVQRSAKRAGATPVMCQA